MKLTVTLPHHHYDLEIGAGAIQNIGEWVRKLWEPQRILIITDDTVNELYGQDVLKRVREAGFTVDLYSVTPGERSKSLENAEKIYEVLARNGMTRKDGVIALGGGVIGDLAGFVASTYMRGLHFLQVPTTLLAQVDSSVGGKTAVNTKSAKNLVGTFAQPDGVLIDTDTLKTLEDRRIREGIAEIVKTAAIADEALWSLLSSIENEQKLLEHSEEVITACCNVKRKVVEADEKDTGERLILNYGHTIGHAIENTAGYGVVTHGEAVAIGMVQISRCAEKLGTMNDGMTDMIVHMLEKFHLPVSTDYWNEEAMYQALTHDKKTGGNSIRIVLLEKIGKAKICSIQTEEMKKYLVR